MNTRMTVPAWAVSVGDVIATAARPKVVAIGVGEEDGRDVVLITLDSTPGAHAYSPDLPFEIWRDY